MGVYRTYAATPSEEGLVKNRAFMVFPDTTNFRRIGPRLLPVYVQQPTVRQVRAGRIEEFNEATAELQGSVARTVFGNEA